MGYRSFDLGLMQDVFSLLRSVFLKFNISGTAGNLTSSAFSDRDRINDCHEQLSLFHHGRGDLT